MTSTNLKSNTTFIGELETTIGLLAVFRYRVKGMIAMERYVGDRSASEITPSDYIRKLISITSFHVEDVFGGVEPEEQLSSVEIKELSLDDLDSFSALFLKHHEYLEKERRFITEDKEGSKKLSFEWGERTEQRLEGEREHEYLHRLLALEQKSIKEQGENNLAQMGLSPSLIKQFEHTTRFGSAIDQQLKAMAPLTAASASLPKGLGEHLASVSKITRATDNLTKPLASVLRQQEALNKAFEPIKGINNSDSPNLHTSRKLTRLPKEILSPQSILTPGAQIEEALRKKHEQEEERHQKALEVSQLALQRTNEQIEALRAMNEQMKSLVNIQLTSAAENRTANQGSSKFAKWNFLLGVAVLISTIAFGGYSIYSTYPSNNSEHTVVESVVSVSTNVDETKTIAADKQSESAPVENDTLQTVDTKKQ